MKLPQLIDVLVDIQNQLTHDQQTNVLIRDGIIEIWSLGNETSGVVSYDISSDGHDIIIKLTTESSIALD